MSQDSDSGRSLSVDRRTFLGMVGGASAAAAAVGASGGGNPEESLSIGGQSMPINEAYQIAQNYYAGPESARPAAADAEGTIWEVTDAGSNQKTRRTISDGSSWLTLNVKNEVVETDKVINKNYVEKQVTASDGSSYTADLSQANYHKLTLTGNVTIDFSNVDSADVNSVILHLVQDGTGSRTPSFTPTVVWAGGSAPSWSTAAGAEDVVTLVHDQDASQWLGFKGGLDFA